MFGKIPDLDSPKTFNENICSRKFRSNREDYWVYTDKFEVRNYVRNLIGDEYLNKIFGIYETVEDIDYLALPQSFVLKCTHGSSYNIIVKDKSITDEVKIKKQIDKWLKEIFFFKDREINYLKIQPRIICEKFLESKKGFLEEFKIFCFYGKVKFIQHNQEIKGKRYSNLYDENWEFINVKYGYSRFKSTELPNNRSKMIEIARILSKSFDFVRVDMYNIDGKIVFSELTFNSGGGLIPFFPNKYDIEFGKFFNKG